MMFPPDRMISHNLSPRCSRGSELSAYMDREWNATTAYMGDRGRGEDPVKDEPGPSGLLARVVRSTRTMVRAALL